MNIKDIVELHLGFEHPFPLELQYKAIVMFPHNTIPDFDLREVQALEIDLLQYSNEFVHIDQQQISEVLDLMHIQCPNLLFVRLLIHLSTLIDQQTDANRDILEKIQQIAKNPRMVKTQVYCVANYQNIKDANRMIQELKDFSKCQKLTFSFFRVKASIKYTNSDSIQNKDLSLIQKQQKQIYIIHDLKRCPNIKEWGLRTINLTAQDNSKILSFLSDIQFNHLLVVRFTHSNITSIQPLAKIRAPFLRGISLMQTSIVPTRSLRKLESPHIELLELNYQIQQFSCLAHCNWKHLKKICVDPYYSRIKIFKSFESFEQVAKSCSCRSLKLELYSGNLIQNKVMKGKLKQRRIDLCD